MDRKQELAFWAGIDFLKLEHGGERKQDLLRKLQKVFKDGSIFQTTLYYRR